MRTNRLPLIALVMAALLFAATLFYRVSQPAPEIPPLATANPELAQTPLATAIIPTFTPNANISAVHTGTSASYREGLAGTVQRLNPLLASLNPVDADISALIFEGLTAINQYGEPMPALAERWIISADGLEYVVFLRGDVLWQDGVPFGAADVLYTTSLLRSPDFPGDAALRQFWSTVEVEQLGDLVVRFRLTQPLGSFLEQLTIGMLPEHALHGTTAANLAAHPINLAPIGTGPYQLAALRGDDSGVREVELRAAPVYRSRREAQSLPYALDPVTFVLYPTFDAAQDALAENAIDTLAATTPAEREGLFLLSNNAGLDVYNQIENRLGALIFNWQNTDRPYFRDQRTRVALQAALDVPAIIERVMANSAVPADSPILPGSWAYLANMPWATYDPARARTLIQQAADRVQRANAADEDTPTAVPDSGQVAPGADPTATPTEAPPPVVRFEFSILVPDDPVLVQLAQEIAAQWSQVGVTALIATATPEEFRRRLDDGEFDTAIVEMELGNSADPDVYDFWHQGQYPDGENVSGVDDRQISVLLERARRDPYGVNRMQDYADFQRKFAEHAIALPLYYPLFTFVAEPRVQGIQLGFIGQPADRFRNVGAWTLQNQTG